MKASPAEDRSGDAADPHRAEDRELRAGGAGQQLGGRVGVLELLRAHPPLPLDGEVAQQRHLRRRTAEAERAHASPLADNRGQWDVWPHRARR
jgi:hypothetical protein